MASTEDKNRNRNRQIVSIVWSANRTEQNNRNMKKKTRIRRRRRFSILYAYSLEVNFDGDAVATLPHHCSFTTFYYCRRRLRCCCCAAISVELFVCVAVLCEFISIYIFFGTFGSSYCLLWLGSVSMVLFFDIHFFYIPFRLNLGIYVCVGMFI